MNSLTAGRMLLGPDGCVIQKPDGVLEKVSTEEAERYVGALDQSRQNLYI